MHLLSDTAKSKLNKYGDSLDEARWHRKRKNGNSPQIWRFTR